MLSDNLKKITDFVLSYFPIDSKAKEEFASNIKLKIYCDVALDLEGKQKDASERTAMFKKLEGMTEEELNQLFLKDREKTLQAYSAALQNTFTDVLAGLEPLLDVSEKERFMMEVKNIYNQAKRSFDESIKQTSV